MDTINAIVSKNIKELRTGRDLSLDELARLSGVSKSMLVQIERGIANPSLSTLWKIANGMKLPFNTLVSCPKPPFEVVRLSDLDPILGADGKIRNYTVFPDDEGRHFSIYRVEVESGCSWRSEPHLHGTVEFVLVLNGALEIQAEEHVFQVREGENLRFRADSIHTYRNISSKVTIFHNILYNP